MGDAHFLEAELGAGWAQPQPPWVLSLPAAHPQTGTFPQPRVTPIVQGVESVPSKAAGAPSAQVSRPAVWLGPGHCGHHEHLGESEGPLSGSRRPALYRTDSRWGSPGGGAEGTAHSGRALDIVQGHGSVCTRARRCPEGWGPTSPLPCFPALKELSAAQAGWAGRKPGAAGPVRLVTLAQNPGLDLEPHHPGSQTPPGSWASQPRGGGGKEADTGGSGFPPWQERLAGAGTKGGRAASHVHPYQDLHSPAWGLRGNAPLRRLPAAQPPTRPPGQAWAGARTTWPLGPDRNTGGVGAWSPCHCAGGKSAPSL